MTKSMRAVPPMRMDDLIFGKFQQSASIQAA
jgi:hypothetical protein